MCYCAYNILQWLDVHECKQGLIRVNPWIGAESHGSTHRGDEHDEHTWEKMIQMVALIDPFHRCTRIFAGKTIGKIAMRGSRSLDGEKNGIGRLQSKRPNPSRIPRSKKRINHIRDLEQIK
jgi:hypothetical protein